MLRKLEASGAVVMETLKSSELAGWVVIGTKSRLSESVLAMNMEAR
jgi:hypothetical protein